VRALLKAARDACATQDFIPVEVAIHQVSAA
jgi:hypothetical protein